MNQAASNSYFFRVFDKALVRNRAILDPTLTVKQTRWYVAKYAKSLSLKELSHCNRFLGSIFLSGNSGQSLGLARWKGQASESSRRLACSSSCRS
jgi:hypothetical protein